MGGAQARLSRAWLGSAVAVALIASVLVVVPAPPASADPVTWVGTVVVTNRYHNEHVTDRSSATETLHSTTYKLAPGATDTSEITWTAAYSHVSQTVEPTTCNNRRVETYGSGDGDGGISFSVQWYASNGRNLIPGYDLRVNALQGAVSIPTVTTTSGVSNCVPYSFQGEGATTTAMGWLTIPATSDNAWVLTGQMPNEWHPPTVGYDENVSYRLRRADCTGAPDSDGDGLHVCQEFDLGTDPDNPDTDGDGFPDGGDACPLEPGSFGGCPATDTDGDGVDDSTDECPDTPEGTPVDATGCPSSDCSPDTDGDGLDSCEESELGTDADNPDTDGDGFPDGTDACPLEPGSASGCPATDTDGDGVDDSTDQCPDTPEGTPVDATGCPNVPEAPDAVDDPAPGSVYQEQTGLGNRLTIPVTANDTGSGIRVTSVQGGTGTPGSLTHTDSSVVWDLPGGTRPALGTYRISYQITDAYGRTDIATIRIRLYDCFSITPGISASTDRAGLDDGWSLSASTRVCFDGEEVFDVGDGAEVDRQAPVDLVPNGVTAQWTLPTLDVADTGQQLRLGISADASECLAALDAPWGRIPKTFGQLRQLFASAYGQSTAIYIARNYSDELNEAYESIADNSSYCFTSYLSVSLSVHYDASGVAAITIQSDVRRRDVRSVVATFEKRAPDSGAGGDSRGSQRLPTRGSHAVSFMCDAYTGCWQP